MYSIASVLPRAIGQSSRQTKKRETSFGENHLHDGPAPRMGGDGTMVMTACALSCSTGRAVQLEVAVRCGDEDTAGACMYAELYFKYYLVFNFVAVPASLTAQCKP